MSHILLVLFITYVSFFKNHVYVDGSKIPTPIPSLKPSISKLSRKPSSKPVLTTKPSNVRPTSKPLRPSSKPRQTTRPSTVRPTSKPLRPSSKPGKKTNKPSYIPS